LIALGHVDLCFSHIFVPKASAFGTGNYITYVTISAI